MLLWAVLWTPSSRLMVFICAERSLPKEFSTLPSIALVFLCISISNSHVRKLTLSELGVKMLLLVWHVSLKVKYFKSWYRAFCLSDTKAGLIQWGFFFSNISQSSHSVWDVLGFFISSEISTFRTRLHYFLVMDFFFLYVWLIHKFIKYLFNAKCWSNTLV